MIAPAGGWADGSQRTGAASSHVPGEVSTRSRDTPATPGAKSPHVGAVAPTLSVSRNGAGSR